MKNSFGRDGWFAVTRPCDHAPTPDATDRNMISSNFPPPSSTGSFVGSLDLEGSLPLDYMKRTTTLRRRGDPGRLDEIQRF